MKTVKLNTQVSKDDVTVGQEQGLGKHGEATQQCSGKTQKCQKHPALSALNLLKAMCGELYINTG